MATDHVQFEQDVNSFFNPLPKSSFRKARCPFCSPKTEKTELFIKNTMRVMRCKCGFVYNENQPNKETLDIFYKKSCAMQTWGKLKQSEVEKERQRDKFSDIITYLTRESVESVLDIGCGTGKFLSMLPKKINSVGIDPHQQSIDYAKALKVNAYCLSIEQYLNTLNKSESRFGAVTLWGILEHYRNIKWLIRTAHKVLAEKGKIIICVPNVDSLAVTTLREKCFTFCPQHLWYFNITILKKLLLDNGFKIVNYWTIEDEIFPILKHRNLLDPYEPHPEWIKLGGASILLKQEILHDNLGYKIIMIGEKI